MPLIGLKGITREVKKLQALRDHVIKALPKELQPYCHSVYWSDSTLIVNITHQAALSKTRLLCPSLLKTLQHQGIQVKTLKFVIFFNSMTTATKPKSQKMTPAALEAFSTLAQATTDPDLKEALTNLLIAHK